MRALPTLALLLAGLLVAGGLTARAAAERGHVLIVQEPESDQDQDAEARDPEEIRTELAAAERQHQLAFARNRLAGIEEDLEREAAVLERTKAAAALTAFETHEQSARIAESELTLRMEKDGAEDARDEKEQLAALYGQGDLAEKTAELVLRRADRSLARAEEALRLMEDGHRQLVNVTLPRELFELRQEALACDRLILKLEAQKELRQLEFADEVAQSESEIRRLKAELAKAEAGAAEKK